MQVSKLGLAGAMTRSSPLRPPSSLYRGEEFPLTLLSRENEFLNLVASNYTDAT